MTTPAAKGSVPVVDVYGEFCAASAILPSDHSETTWIGFAAPSNTYCDNSTVTEWGR